MKTRIILAISTAITLLACGSDGPTSSTPTLVNSQQSACKQLNPEQALPPAPFDAQVSGNDLLILHNDAMYNCNAKLQMEGTVSGTEIVVVETITNPNDAQARCACPFDLSVQVTGLPAGTYLVKLSDAGGNLVGSTTVSIGVPPSTLDVVNALQSACKATPIDLPPGEDASFSVAGRVLTVSHENARYNCAAKVKLEATLAGNDITVKEAITNPGELAKCMCDFDLSVELKGLPAGTYTVYLFNADGQLVRSSAVVVL